MRPAVGDRARAFGLVEKVVGITPLMGGTQRMAERAGTARAREFVITGGLYDASTLHTLGRGQPGAPGGRLLEEARAFAPHLAAGPTIAHAATKAVVRAQADHGTRAPTSALRPSPHTCSRPTIHAMRCRVPAEGPGKATSPVSEYSHLTTERKGPSRWQTSSTRSARRSRAREGAEAAGRGVPPARGGRAALSVSAPTASPHQPATAAPPRRRRSSGSPAPAGAAARAAAARAPLRRSSW